jgi:hypothetical protein
MLFCTFENSLIVLTCTILKYLAPVLSFLWKSWLLQGNEKNMFCLHIASPVWFKVIFSLRRNCIIVFLIYNFRYHTIEGEILLLLFNDSNLRVTDRKWEVHADGHVPSKKDSHFMQSQIPFLTRKMPFYFDTFRSVCVLIFRHGHTNFVMNWVMLTLSEN